MFLFGMDLFLADGIRAIHILLYFFVKMVEKNYDSNRFVKSVHKMHCVCVGAFRIKSNFEFIWPNKQNKHAKLMYANKILTIELKFRFRLFHDIIMYI